LTCRNVETARHFHVLQIVRYDSSQQLSLWMTILVE
jgi:hypothetical protein